MTSNDPGHINNLNKTEKETLKLCWIHLINRICKENNIFIDELIQSIYGDELFNAIGYDNPDIILLRWLRANKWNVENSIEKLLNTFKWRHDFNINKIIEQGENELIQNEIKSGLIYIMGKDKYGHPITYIKLTNQFLNKSAQLLTIFTIETCRKLLENDCETCIVIIDMKDFSIKNLDYDSIKFLINLLENHYPESLHMAFVINAPFLFNSCWNIVKYWLDPVVQNKIVFLKHQQQLIKYIDSSILPNHLNGTQMKFKYIQPTEQDKQILLTIKNDHQGQQIARLEHRKAAENYLNITLKWANDHDNIQTLSNQRKKAQIKLRNTFRQLIPYISTQTHYHRQGLINEPIFDITYQKILQAEQEYITMF